MLRKAVKQIAVCAALLILFCVVSRFAISNTYTAYFPVPQPMEGGMTRSGGQMDVEVERPEILRREETDVRDGYVRVRVRPERAGNTMLDLKDASGRTLSSQYLRVGPFNTVYNLSSGGFTGDTAALIAVTLFWLLVAAIMLWHYFRAKGPAYYAYSTIYYAGFSIFALVTGLVMLEVTMRHILAPARFSMMEAYSAISNASTRFMILTTPLIVLFAAAMAVSNAALLRRERAKLNNVAGLAVTALLLAGETVGWYLFSRDFSGPEWEGRLHETLQNSYATVFSYFECMLAGSVICGVKAAQRQPAPDKDFIIILGCWFRKDGTLPPLLKGRVDGAIAFWKKQKALSGKEAVFIPSGGQGSDEPMAEAAAMRNYLLNQGIPERLILPEDQSRNTYQNMAFSRQIIQDTKPEGKAAFATTSYHVFRSGVWASFAGLAVEGIGAKTKWWYGPNAFMRECAGLLKKRWKQETLMLVIVIAFFALLSMVVR